MVGPAGSAATLGIEGQGDVGKSDVDTLVPPRNQRSQPDPFSPMMKSKRAFLFS